MAQIFHYVNFSSSLYPPHKVILYPLDHHIFLKIQMICKIYDSHSARAYSVQYLICTIYHIAIINHLYLLVPKNNREQPKPFPTAKLLICSSSLVYDNNNHTKQNNTYSNDYQNDPQVRIENTYVKCKVYLLYLLISCCIITCNLKCLFP